MFQVILKSKILRSNIQIQVEPHACILFYIESHPLNKALYDKNSSIFTLLQNWYTWSILLANISLILIFIWLNSFVLTFAHHLSIINYMYNWRYCNYSHYAIDKTIPVFHYINNFTSYIISHSYYCECYIWKFRLIFIIFCNYFLFCPHKWLTK